MNILLMYLILAVIVVGVRWLVKLSQLSIDLKNIFMYHDDKISNTNNTINNLIDIQLEHLEQYDEGASDVSDNC